MQTALDALQREQAAQREAISSFMAGLEAAEAKSQACMEVVDTLAERHSAADSQLRSMTAAVKQQQAQVIELAAECDRRHETAMKMQQTAATEMSLFSRQVRTSLDTEPCRLHCPKLHLWIFAGLSCLLV